MTDLFRRHKTSAREHGIPGVHSRQAPRAHELYTVDYAHGLREVFGTHGFVLFTLCAVVVVCDLKDGIYSTPGRLRSS